MEPLRARFIASRDGTQLRTACWEFAPGALRHGVCAILDGHTEFIEKYEEVIDELAARGFAGAILDWRGQGESARSLADPLKAHVTDFADYDADLRVFLDEIVRPLTRTHEPILALAHSMGAHILLRELQKDPKAVSASVMVAPMLRLKTQGYADGLVRALSAAHGFLGLSRSWVWGMRGRDPLTQSFEDNRVTSDRRRFERTRACLAANPAFRLAGPSWGWLEAAYRSMTAMRRPGFAEGITTTCLIIGAGQDRVVSTEAVRDFACRLPHGTYVELADAEHEILMENDSIRSHFWSAFDFFVGRTLGAENG